MLIFLAVVAAFILVLVIRALLFNPKDKKAHPVTDVSVDTERAVRNFRDMIRCRTISYDDPSLQDSRAFDEFRALLDERYPSVAAKCEKHRVGPSGVIYHWKGKSSRNPWILMAHYDVVPVEEAMWTENPFEAVVKDGEIWGRGTLDTKSTLMGVMEAAETLIGQDYEPRNDIYLAFGGDEEVNGISALMMSEWFEARKISPTVLDEGGAIVNDVFPGVGSPVAAIGTGEKGIANILFTLEGKGGHASTPPPHTPVGVLAKAIAAVERKPFKAVMVQPVRELFDGLGRHAVFSLKLIYVNLWLFKPILFAVAKRKGGELNAMMRTTCAFTKMEGGTAWNVIPPKVSAGANMRLLNHTPEQAVEILRRLIGNDQVQVDVESGDSPSRYSRTGGEGWETIKDVILQTWPEVIVTPYLMMAATDSRRYARISDRVYRFFPAFLSTELRKTIHGHNERISVDALEKIITFYLRLILKI